ncbi:unnamed protein product [Cylicocyclus nassatus]|uniref:Globin domain-containing protein n=1 Tax=Cylicocyclus nassatus TaxID=53992 RepID=A0AA36M2T4_CYLNA|nr:unnamed protein product [Cylicocyclus nassatus]
MGNESSALVKLRRGSKDKQPAIIEYSERSVTPVYKKKTKSPRSISHGRANEIRRVTPPKIESDNISLKSAATGTPKQLTVEAAELNYLQPLTPDRKRSRSLCTAQLLQDTQAAAAQKQLEDRGSGALMTNGNRKMSTGLVPQLNRLRIQQCFKAARPTMGDAILKRAASNRSEFRSFMSRLNDQQTEHMGKQFYSLIAESVENIERAELIQQHARAFGETYAGLCQLGFRPDFFSALADAAIAECVKLDGGAHKRCETLLAWSQLIGAIFTSVRDGYYNRVRYQRRSSLPQNTLTKQLSLEFSKSIDQDAYIQ